VIQGTPASSPINFATLLFMDPALLRHHRFDTPQNPVLVPSTILQLIGDLDTVHAMCARFFNTIHSWMPIISRKRFYDTCLTPTYHTHPEICLLLLSMQLSMHTLPPDAPDPRNPAYQAAKHFHLELHTAGILSIHLAQAGLLLTLYEIGHAIYPAAVLSVASCARYASVLDIDRPRGRDAAAAASSPGVSPPTRTRLEAEEHHRVWWATLVLDRFASISSPGRPLCTPQPGLDAQLPTDDEAFGDGDPAFPTATATMAEPSLAHMHKFALLCQAARVLGLVLLHVAGAGGEEKGGEALRMMLEDEEQLDRTLRAMIAAAATREIKDYDQVGMVYRCVSPSLPPPCLILFYLSPYFSTCRFSYLPFSTSYGGTPLKLYSKTNMKNKNKNER
jgi:hypothetical protein